MNKIQSNKQTQHRFKIIQHANESRNISLTCRYFGISRVYFYKWYKRYLKYGEHGLINCSKRPKNSPRTTDKNIVRKILYIREYYHFGAQKISYYLLRYHQIKISSSTIHNILKKHDLNRLPQNKKKYDRKREWKRYEKQIPGQRIQVDVKFLEFIPGTKTRLYQYTAIDDCTRLRVLRIYPHNNQGTSVIFLKEVIKIFPFKILTVQTDNGAEFQSKFHWFLEEKGIEHVYIKPRTPRLNGKVERSHRIDNDEFYQLLEDKKQIRDTENYNKKLKEWENYYNFHRPHGALDGQTPYERLMIKRKTKPL